MKKSEKSRTSLYFFGIVLLLYVIISFFKFDIITSALLKSYGLLLKIIPVFVFIFVLMFVINYFVTTKWVVEKFEKSHGINKWIFSIIAGIMSTGPIYMWYPLLSELKDHGLKKGYIATFLYSRAVKPALLPLMFFYFGFVYTLTISFSLIIFSVIQGLIINQIGGLE